MYKLRNAQPDTWQNYKVIMNTEEVAALLGLHPNTVKALAKRGEIPAKKIGRNWRYDRNTLRLWLNNKLEDSADEIARGCDDFDIQSGESNNVEIFGETFCVVLDEDDLVNLIRLAFDVPTYTIDHLLDSLPD